MAQTQPNGGVGSWWARSKRRKVFVGLQRDQTWLFMHRPLRPFPTSGLLKEWVVPAIFA